MRVPKAGLLAAAAGVASALAVSFALAGGTPWASGSTGIDASDGSNNTIQIVHGTPPPGSLPLEVESKLTKSDYSEAGRPFTPEECKDARPRMEGAVRILTESVQKLHSQAETDRLDAAIQESRAWFDAGCPPHPKFGIFPSADGASQKIVYIDY